MTDKTKKVLMECADVVGEEYVSDNAGELSSLTQATFVTQHGVSARIQPADLAELKSCLKIANQNGVPVYLISTGRNWGYGSSSPTYNNSILLDLSRLNEITHYDHQLGTVTVQPGVTQNQLYDFLQEQGGKFWMDVTGSSGECSLLGNTLERGFGHSPYSDHARQASQFEVLLADGRIIQTGMGHFSNANTAHVYQSGIGPSLDGLFLQSNLGIVVSITINLMPTPEYYQAFYFAVNEDNALVELVDALQPLRLNGVLQSALHIGNAYRVLSSIQQYPWEAAEGVTPLPEHVLEALSKQWDFGAWNGSGALYGTRKQVAESRRLIRKALCNKVTKLRFMDDAGLRMAKCLQKPYKWLTGVNLPEMLKVIEPVHGMMKGKPTDRIIASTYWRKKITIPKDMNPDRDRCGLIWCAHVAPTKGVHAIEMVDIATTIMLSHGFEPGMTLTLINERCMDNVMSISYDRDIEGEDDRALSCYQELAETLIKRGYYPYRLGTHSMDLINQYGGKDYVELLRGLKELFDPNQIIARGRYIV
jgi:4-cresol dehydrogenase (hydroxylating) flavoprotein subunit